MLGVEYEEELAFMPSNIYHFYKIVPRDTSLKMCYIGKTKNMKTKETDHILKYENICRCKNIKITESVHASKSKVSDIHLYDVIRKNGGWVNWQMKLFHICLCDEIASVYIQNAIIKQFKEQGYEILNQRIPQVYEKQNDKQEYNKSKCKEHYAIKKNCECGWVGSKMEWSHHLKSKKHNEWLCNKLNCDVDVLIHS